MANDASIGPNDLKRDWAAEGRRPGPPKCAPANVRWMSAAVAAAALTLLVVAWVLNPDSDGIGTHQQLGLPECGWIQAANLPCPSCGMTTAFSHAAHGDLVGSFVAQPMGMILALATAIAVVAGIHTAATGSMLGPFLGSFFGPRLLWIALALGALAWIWKIASHRGIF